MVGMAGPQLVSHGLVPVDQSMVSSLWNWLHRCRLVVGVTI